MIVLVAILLLTGLELARRRGAARADAVLVAERRVE
jgi:hypothetical protein